MCKSTDGDKLPANSTLVPGAGSVHLSAPMLWGKGIIHDFKECVWQHWWKEMINFNQKTVAVTLLVFITVIAPTLTFGAVYGKSTNNNIGAIETMLATSWIGITYALIGGMPLCVIGSTGPVLAFTTALFNIAKNLDVPFLTVYAWTSVWLVGYAFLAAFFDLTRFVRLATRFTDEIFALIIVSIFVLDAVWDPFSETGLFWYLSPGHQSHAPYENDPDYNHLTSALLSILLGFGCTWLIFFFRGFKFSEFFCNQSIRTMVHDFAVIGSVIVFTIVKQFGFPDVPTETLNVPAQFEPTYKCCDASCRTQWPMDCADQGAPFGTRPWFADFGDLNGKGWVPIMCAAPAIGAFLLLYLDNGITWHLINHKSHQLEHGEAYNYDLMLSGFFNMVNGFLGLPWLVASTVPCIIHLQALAETDRNGNILSVQETRLTLLFSHLLVGLSMLVLSALELIPLPVLYGVFLFMGLSSLPKIQFWQRFLLFFKQPAVWPSTPYTDWMKKLRIHKYTVFQTLFFALVFVVQNVKVISIAFPFMVFLCIPARLFVLPKLFEGWELELLDGEDEQIEEWVDAKEESIRNFEKRRTVSMGEESDNDTVNQNSEKQDNEMEKSEEADV
ncbi:HCO3- transporter family protein [Nitzschia inconspicua]|uniref:HCO3- transporter family protein n=1 Tax=Nitzschia inconspicua TaxID=303405 RepID=A0A9K3K931_9STRA|nr:HCO3- transporter family protein [Nitzschia inconspicua]KAG7359483.1 HCO3- transporter family protein [Nitzschia inconspicua]